MKEILAVGYLSPRRLDVKDYFYKFEKMVIETKTGITASDANTVENLMIEVWFTVQIVTK